jgi:hypothetical protein
MQILLPEMQCQGVFVALPVNEGCTVQYDFDLTWPTFGRESLISAQ